MMLWLSSTQVQCICPHSPAACGRHPESWEEPVSPLLSRPSYSVDRQTKPWEGISNLQVYCDLRPIGHPEETCSFRVSLAICQLPASSQGPGSTVQGRFGFLRQFLEAILMSSLWPKVASPLLLESSLHSPHVINIQIVQEKQRSTVWCQVGPAHLSDIWCLFLGLY